MNAYENWRCDAEHLGGCAAGVAEFAEKPGVPGGRSFVAGFGDCGEQHDFQRVERGAVPADAVSGARAVGGDLAGGTGAAGFAAGAADCGKRGLEKAKPYI